MNEDLKKNLECFKAYNVVPRSEDIDEALGIKELNLKPYIWKPYYIKAEEYLRRVLKQELIKRQKRETTSPIIVENIFREYKGTYILISSTKEINEKNPDGIYYSHLIITIYDGYYNYQKNIKRKITRVPQKNKKFWYNKITVSINYFPEKIKNKFDKMGLFSNRASSKQQIYLSRLLPAINLINNNLILTPKFEGHHTFFDTQQEIVSNFSLLLIRTDLHSEIFHPENIKGSNVSQPTILMGILLTNMFKAKYFKEKQKKFNANIDANIYDLLKLYFVEKLSEKEVREQLKKLHPNNPLCNNTIHALIQHYAQYKLVLTPSNIDHIRAIEKW